MNCCICGTVRKCGPYLNKVFENIEKIGSLFDDFKNKIEKYISDLPDDWDSVSFNKPVYYDIWALSIKPFYLSCAHIGDCAGTAMSKYIINILNNAKKDDLIECASAFGGFAIYRTNKFLNCYYYGRLNLSLIPQHLIKQNIDLFKGKFDYSKVEDCEHRYFHLMAIDKNHARIRISPEIVFPEDNVW